MEACAMALRWKHPHTQQWDACMGDMSALEKEY